MAFDLNSIGELISGGGLNAISKRTKVGKEDIAKVLSAGIPALVGGMRRNAGAEDGAKSLAKALADHSADDISNPAEFLKNADLKDGKKILGHVLGGDQKQLVDEISRAAGVTKGKTTSILSLAAPLLLSSLGSQNNSQQSSSDSGLLGLLGGLLGGGQSSGGSLLGGLLGGGSQQQSSGGSLLGSLLGGSSDSNASLASGLFASLLGGDSGASNAGGNTIQIVEQQAQQQESSGGLMDTILNLFR
jgi:hypothetical protein